MDAFLLAAKELAEQLLPSFGVIALAFLIALLYQLIKFVKRLGDNLHDLDKTIDLINTSIDKVQGPLDTADSLSKTIDKVHESGIIAFKEAASYAVTNFQVIKEYFRDRNNSRKENEDE